MSERVPAWVGWSYVAYCFSTGVIVWGGTGYAVFVLGHSGWWFALAFTVMALGFSPNRWRRLLTGIQFEGDKTELLH